MIQCYYCFIPFAFLPVPIHIRKEFVIKHTHRAWVKKITASLSVIVFLDTVRRYGNRLLPVLVGNYAITNSATDIPRVCCFRFKNRKSVCSSITPTRLLSLESLADRRRLNGVNFLNKLPPNTLYSQTITPFRNRFLNSYSRYTLV